jgi:hypothetical protein
MREQARASAAITECALVFAEVDQGTCPSASALRARASLALVCPKTLNIQTAVTSFLTCSASLGIDVHMRHHSPCEHPKHPA